MSYILDDVKPCYYDSIASYRKEMLESGSSFDGCSSLDRYDDIEKWDLNNRLFEKWESVPPGYSLGYEYVYADEGEVIGMVNIRPEADSHPFLKEYGGHIGYSVRPARRNNGVGTLMLRDTLDLIRERFALDRVLITCLNDNIGSRKVIENNGGVFENEVFYSPENAYLERFYIVL